MNRRDFLRIVALSTAATALPNIRSFSAEPPFDVYLTFDDGPFPAEDFKSGPTDIVLQVLKDAGASATFFLHGRHILDWHGPVLARYINDGHTIGNHLWTQGGNLIKNKPSMVRLAYQFLLTEARIRAVMRMADENAYQRYLKQPRLFRRPGGKNGLNDFLDLRPDYQRDLEFSAVLRSRRDNLEWIKGTYDYSGWHVNGGESIPLKVRPLTSETQRKFVLDGGAGFPGVMAYLQVGVPPTRSLEVQQGLIVLMHDFDPNTYTMLPQLLEDIKILGGRFRALPRPIDKPNSFTVGIGYPPTPAPSL